MTFSPENKDETVNDALFNLSYLISNALGLARAVCELTLSDCLISSNDIAEGSTEKLLKVLDLLRLHNTSSSLLFVLCDILESIETEVDRVEEAYMRERADRAKIGDAFRLEAIREGGGKS